MMILGIDVGGSTTKIAGVEDGQIRSAQSIVAADPVTSLFGALGKYIYDNGIDLADISRIMLTGVGSAANFISLGTGIKDFVLIGNLSLLPQCRSVFDRIGRLYGLDFHIPEHTLYRTALGAALYALKDNG